MSAPTILTKFLVISDTHNVQLDENMDHPFHLPLPHVEVLLHCGDLTQCGGHSSFKKALKMLGSIPADLKFIIAGNHDAFANAPWLLNWSLRGLSMGGYEHELYLSTEF